MASGILSLLRWLAVDGLPTKYENWKQQVVPLGQTGLEGLSQAQKASFPRLQTVRPDRMSFWKFTGSIPIWYLKRPGRSEDRGTGLGIFFGGLELPKKPSKRKKIGEWTGYGGSGRPDRRATASALPAAATALQTDFCL
ncbi:hypothetical protein JCGZ_19665 [Jatropha curcas]|uniref:Uncharacterized protein n=1 Tax=Jatropha curcas TaxID=180498 RepID=A0A067JYK2_JATCU|nr:hypothetical protein JCGZ_19665 [Jatropha curcas]